MQSERHYLRSYSCVNNPPPVPCIHSPFLHSTMLALLHYTESARKWTNPLFTQRSLCFFPLVHTIPSLIICANSKCSREQQEWNGMRLWITVILDSWGRSSCLVLSLDSHSFLAFGIAFAMSFFGGSTTFGLRSIGHSEGITRTRTKPLSGKISWRKGELFPERRCSCWRGLMGRTLKRLSTRFSRSARKRWIPTRVVIWMNWRMIWMYRNRKLFNI